MLTRATATARVELYMIMLTCVKLQKGLRLITASREQDVHAMNTLLEAGVDPDSTNQVVNY